MDDCRVAKVRFRATESLFRQLLRTASDGIHILDVRGNLVLASDSFYRMLGYDPVDPPPLTVTDWDPRAREDEVQAILARDTAETKTFRTRHSRSDGTIFDAEINARSVELDGERFIYASSRDITARVQAEERAARDLAVTTALRHVLRLSLADLDLRDILLAALDELLALPWLHVENRGSIFLMEEDGSSLVMAARRNMEAECTAGCGRIAVGQCLCGRAALGRVVFKDSIDDEHEIRSAAMVEHGHYCVPIDHAGTVLGVLNIHVAHGHRHDEEEQRVLVMFADTLAGIVARKRAEAALRSTLAELTHHRLHLEDLVRQRTEEVAAREARLREVLDLNADILATSAAGIAVYHRDGRCVQVNPAFAATIGGSEAQILAQNLHHLPSWREAGLLDLAKGVLGSGKAAARQIRLHTTFGRQLWLDCQLSRLIRDGVPHLLLMFRDVTAERQASEALEERERLLRTLADNVPDHIVRCDRDGHVLYVNRAVELGSGRPAADLIGRTAAENYPDGRFAALDRAMRGVAATGKAADFDLTVPGPNGRAIYHQVRIVPEPGPDGRPASVMAVGRDLTRQRRAEEQLRLAASVFQSSSEGLLVTDAEGTIISVNPAFTDITGYSAAEALGHTPRLLRSDRHPPEFYRAMWETLTPAGLWQGEIWNRRKSGEAYLEWLTINRIDDDAGRPVHYASVFHDITESRRKDERIQHLAFHDALTGLPNRALLMDRLQHALARARREGRRLSVTFVDLDRFKAINDSLGHDVGDLLLQEVAQRICGRLRAMDTVARMGGDEFVVMMEDLAEIEDCAILAAQLIAAIARPMDLRGHRVEVGASMGIAFFPEDGDDPLTLMKNADMAMYAAKAAGRNTYRFFQAEMQDQAVRRLDTEMDLRTAIAQGGLELHYQPKVDLADGKVRGVEALVRWHHPVSGLLSPAEFVPLAEESSLILDLGNWVLDQACRQAAAWQANGLNLRIAINVSAKQLDAGDLAERVAEATSRHGVSPSRLELELTESAVMANPAHAAGLFARLRQLGITIAVDDFGTGYSSLAYLRRLPIDVLKIDRSFVADADTNGDDAQIVKTILALGQTLKLTVVAEGIETQQQAEVLGSVGCTLAQGFHFARPLPAHEVESWLRERGSA